METEKNLKVWVSDKLMALLGYSNPIVVGYMVGLTEEATSPAGVVEKLEEFRFPSRTERVDFAEEIFARVHRKPFYLNPCPKHSRASTITVPSAPAPAQPIFSAALRHFHDLISVWDEAFTHSSKAWQDYQIDKARAKSNLEKLQEEEIGFSSHIYLHSLRDEFLEIVHEYQVLFIYGETGSRKTTRIPQFLYEAGYTEFGRKKIGCIQPTRVTVLSAAARVSQEMGVELGHEVGYSIRFEDCTSQNTVLKFMSDGMLLREFLVEPNFSSYNVLIVDEAQERMQDPSLLFELLKEITRIRSDLKLLLISNSLMIPKLFDFFKGAPIFFIPFRRPSVPLD